MNTPPEITFHDVDRSAWVEDYIGQRLQRLDRIAPDMTRCHVTVSKEQASQHKGNHYSVMVEVRLPRQHDLAVKKQKEIRDMPTQLPALINLAFGAIERQLKKTLALRRHEEKSHVQDGQLHGMVERVLEDGYGFIRTVDDDRQFYFHRNSVLHDGFGRLTIGTEVRFSPEEGEEGPQASSVHVVSKPGVRAES